MKALLISKKQMPLFILLALFFSFNASMVLALNIVPKQIDKRIVINENKPIIISEFIPIDKTPEVKYPIIDSLLPIKTKSSNLTINKLVKDKYSITKISPSPVACTTPTSGMEITGDTTLCQGEHVYNGSSSAFITIKTDNVTLDCDGATLSVVNNSGGQPAIAITGNGGINSNNIIVKNCIINNFYYPIITNGVEYTTISNITFDKGAIWIDDYNYGEISYLNKPLTSNNSNSLASLHVTNSNYNDFHHNTIYGSYGISLISKSSFNLIHDNSLGYITNTAAYPTAFYLGQGANNNEFYDNEIKENTGSNTYGVVIYGDNNPTYGNTINNKIYNNNFSNNNINIFLSDNATANEINNNTILNSSWNGILMWPYETATYGWEAPHDNIVDNNYFSNGFRDIVITNQVNSNSFINNTFDNTNDVVIFIYRDTSPSSMAVDNEFLNNSIIGTGNIGIQIMNNASQNSYFESNNIKNRTITGLVVGAGNINTSLILNNFVNNTEQVIDDSNSTYDNVLGGNFWSDFDEPSEGCADVNLDGKCDLDYYGIMGTGNNVDTQPFTGAPILNPISNIFINELDHAIINMIATDPQDDPLSYSIDNANFLSMAGCWPDSHAFSWTTNTYSAGSYTVNATVSDGIHEVSYPISINVANTCQINKKGVMECSSHYKPVSCY